VDYDCRISPDGLHIAQINIAQARGPIDSPLMAEFVALLDSINALADGSPGFVWRLQTEDGDATSIHAYHDERVIINMSVWDSIDRLADFVYRSGHLEVMRRRREWFDRIRMHIALWWIPEAHVPSVTEAVERLSHLGEHGPTPYAFTFKTRFMPGRALVVNDEIACPA